MHLRTLLITERLLLHVRAYKSWMQGFADNANDGSSIARQHHSNAAAGRLATYICTWSSRIR